MKKKTTSIKKKKALAAPYTPPEEGHIILGVDPGLERTGLGLIKIVDGKAVYLAHYLVKTKPAHMTHVRLRNLLADAHKALAKYEINKFVIEEVFVGINRNTIIKLSMARSVMMLLAGILGACVIHVPTKIVKQKVAGSGSADKTDVLASVKEKLGLRDFDQLDCSDALACALYATLM